MHVIVTQVGSEQNEFMPWCGNKKLPIYIGQEQTLSTDA
jgi:hypothetical protein